jgi:flagellar hook protein FlgE
LTIDTAATQHATSISVYDSQGGRHNLTLTFTKSFLPNQWSWSAEFSGNEMIRSGGTGTITFNPDGSLGSFQYTGGATQLQVDPNNGSEQMQIDLLAGTSGGFDGLTSFAAESNAAARDQNGYGMGILSNISIDPSGTITGIFTNGVTRVLAQIYVAEFNNNGGLLKVGESMFQTSANSGSPIAGIAGETTSSTITSGALEISNVDLAQEFTNMIVAQRGFQANARIITTSDEMLNELVALKR